MQVSGKVWEIILYFYCALILFSGCSNIVSDTAEMCNTTATRSVVFDNTSDIVQCVSVGIRGDTIVEETETFDVVFFSNDQGAFISENTTTVSIIDNDGKQNHYL